MLKDRLEAPIHPPGALPKVRNARRSLVVFAELQRDIMLGRLAPRDLLPELEIAARFQCSQSTVREALLKLQEEGLVLRKGHRGTMVADCNAHDARELLRIRHDIECRAVPRALERYDKTVHAALTGAFDKMRQAATDEDEYVLSVHDRDFHTTLFAAADLPAVAPILGRCLIHNHRYKILNSAPNRALAETAERHAVILDALAAGDGEALRAALSHHIATIVDMGPSIFETQEPMGPTP
ncbi:MAG: GntR family transcriptional regulator [Devosia sp.]